jgi:hypothetical protein
VNGTGKVMMLGETSVLFGLSQYDLATIDGVGDVLATSEGAFSGEYPQWLQADARVIEMGGPCG